MFTVSFDDFVRYDLCMLDKFEMSSFLPVLDRAVTSLCCADSGLSCLRQTSLMIKRSSLFITAGSCYAKNETKEQLAFGSIDKFNIK